MIASLVIAASLVAGAVSAAPAPSSAQPMAQPLGIWNTSDDDSQVRITACGVAVCGYPVTPAPSAEAPAHLDVHNPDPALRGRPMSKIQIFKLEPVQNGLWRGWIYSPRNGKTYKAALKMEGPERLKLTGCLVGPLCSSQFWTRAAGPAAAGDSAPS
jgi:uncharacterized protein (DUF2147 family)